MADFGGYKDADGVTHPPPAIAARAIAIPRESKYLSLIKMIEAAIEKMECSEDFANLPPEAFIDSAAETILQYHNDLSTAEARIGQLESELRAKEENANNLQHQLGQDTPARPNPVPNDSTSASQNDMEVDKPKKLTKKMFDDMAKKYAILEEKYKAAKTKADQCTCSTVIDMLDEFEERLDTAIEATKADLGDAESEYYNADNYIEWSRKEILALRELVSKLKATDDEAVNEERAADRDRIADLEHDAITQMQRADDYEKKLKDDRMEIQQMNHDKMQHQIDLTEAQRVCAERQIEIAQLESRVASLQDANATQNSSLESSHSTIRACNAKIAQYESDSRSYSSSVQADIENLQGTIKQRDATIAQYESDSRSYSSSVQADIENLQGTIKQRDATIAQYESDSRSYSSSVQTDIQKLQGTISQRDATIQDLRRDLVNVQAQLDRTVAEKNEAQRAHENEKIDAQSRVSSSRADESEEDEAANPTHSLQISQPTLGNEVPLSRNQGQTSECKAFAQARGGQDRVLGSTSKVGKPIKNDQRQSHTPSQLRSSYLLQGNDEETDNHTNPLSQPSKHNVVQPSQIPSASSETMASDIWSLPSRLPHLVSMVTKVTISRQENEIQQLKEAIEHHKKEMADFKASIDPKTGALIDRERRALPWTKDQLTAARTQLHHANSRIADLEYYRKGFQATITSLQDEKKILRSDNSRLEKKSRKADGKDVKIKGMEKELESREEELKEALTIQASTFDKLEESKKAAQQTEAALQEAQDTLLEKNTTINALKVTVDKEKASADMCRRAMKRTPMFPEHNVRMLKDLRKKFDASIPDPAKVIDDLLSEPITRLPTLADCRIPCQQPSVHSLEKDEAVAPPKVEQNTSPKAVPVAQSLWNRWAGWLWNSGEKNVA